MFLILILILIQFEKLGFNFSSLHAILFAQNSNVVSCVYKKMQHSNQLRDWVAYFWKFLVNVTQSQAEYDVLAFKFCHDLGLWKL